MNSHNKVSIIIPVYNATRYISRCLDSLSKQKYQCYEIIVIDDGSTDDSYTICEQYERADSRIKVLRQNNKGAGGARNTGLAYATGKYVCFVDIDDWIESDFLEETVSLIEKYEADMVITGKEIKKEICERIWSRTDALNSFFRVNGEKDGHSVWGRLFTRRMLEGFIFKERVMNEDVMACYELALRSERIIYTGKKYYNYCFNNESLTNQEFTSKRKDLLLIWNEVYEKTRKELPSYAEVCRMNYIRAHLTLILQMHVMGYDKNDIELIKFKQDLKKVLRRNYWQLMKWKMPISRKIALSFVIILG